MKSCLMLTGTSANVLDTHAKTIHNIPSSCIVCNDPKLTQHLCTHDPNVRVRLNRSRVNICTGLAMVCTHEEYMELEVYDHASREGRSHCCKTHHTCGWGTALPNVVEAYMIRPLKSSGSWCSVSLAGPCGTVSGIVSDKLRGSAAPVPSRWGTFRSMPPRLHPSACIVPPRTS